MTFENSPVFVTSGLSRRALKGRTARRLTDAPPLGGREDAVIKLGELVMILDLHRQGLSVSAIARQLGVDRKTVRTYIAKGLEPPAYKKRAPAPAIVDPFEPYLLFGDLSRPDRRTPMARDQGARLRRRLQRRARSRAASSPHP